MRLGGNSKAPKARMHSAVHRMSEAFFLSWYHMHLSKISAMAQSVFFAGQHTASTE